MPLCPSGSLSGARTRPGWLLLGEVIWGHLSVLSQQSSFQAAVGVGGPRPHQAEGWPLILKEGTLHFCLHISARPARWMGAQPCSPLVPGRLLELTPWQQTSSKGC